MSPGRRTGAGRMSGFGAVAVAIVKGFRRDKMSTFFPVVFPLMFLVRFGGVFSYDSSPKIDMIQVGDLPS
jgi:ABC-2 type transport system permease protein